MKLYNFFLLILSFICTLSDARPGQSLCVPLNEGGGFLRVANGATVSAFSDQVRIRVVQDYMEPSVAYPLGGLMVDIINEYCLRVRVTFIRPDGRRQVFIVRGRDVSLNTWLRGHLAHNTIIQVIIEDRF
jgi:hypothetical protein